MIFVFEVLSSFLKKGGLDRHVIKMGKPSWKTLYVTNYKFICLEWILFVQGEVQFQQYPSENRVLIYEPFDLKLCLYVATPKILQLSVGKDR